MLYLYALTPFEAQWFHDTKGYDFEICADTNHAFIYSCHGIIIGLATLF